MRADLYVSLRRSGINPDGLKDLHRIVLTTDGTVTDILEAYFRERMVVVALHQELIASGALTAPHQAALRFAPGDEGQALIREILLRGEISDSCHLYATSAIAIDRLPPEMRAQLLELKQPIGQLLLEQRIPTFKEIVDVHREPAGPLATYFGIAQTAPLLCRTYVMSIDQRPAMVITEKLPEFGR